MPGTITGEKNSIRVSGDFTTREMPRLIAAMHNVISKAGYREISLDFSDCTSAFAGPMLGVVSRCQLYWSEEIDIRLSVPTDDHIKRLFLNTNWAYLIDPHTYQESRYTGYQQIPAIRYSDGKQQHDAVSLILNRLLGYLTEFKRSDLRCIEWALNEITDNVINHAQSPVGGFVQITNFTKKNRRVEFAVCDAGIGIPSSLRSTHSEAVSKRVEWPESS